MIIFLLNCRIGHLAACGNLTELIGNFILIRSRSSGLGGIPMDMALGEAVDKGHRMAVTAPRDRCQERP
jgi:hypothetical protein